MATRGQRIARGRGRGYDKLRTVFLEGVCLRILSGDQNSSTVEATYDSHWFLDRQERLLDLTTGKKYLLLRIADHEGCRLETLRKMTAVQIGNPQVGWEEFKFAVKPTFLPGMMPLYEFKINPTGRRV